MMTLMRSSAFETPQIQPVPVLVRRLSNRRGLLGVGLLLTFVVIIPVLVRLNNA